MVACKKKSVCCDEPIIVGAPTNIDVDRVVAHFASDGKSFTKDKSDIGRNTGAPVFAWSCSLQATGDMKVIGQGKLDVAEQPFDARVSGEVGILDSSDATRDAAWSGASLVASSGVENADLVTFLAHNQELQAEKKVLLARRAGKQKTQMDTLLMLCFEKKKSGSIELQVRSLIQQLTDVSAVQGKGVI